MRRLNRLLCALFPFALVFTAYSPASAAGGARRTTAAAAALPSNESYVAAANALTAALSEIGGSVLARESQGSTFTDATDGYILEVLGQVQTESDGKVRLDFSTGTIVRVGPDTLFTLQLAEQSSQGPFIGLQLAAGKLWVVLQGGSLEVETESGVASVLGSLLSVESKPGSDKVKITCLEGHCGLSNPAGEVQIGAGQSAETGSWGEPPKVGQMTYEDYQDWLDNVPESKPFVPYPQGHAKDDETLGISNQSVPEVTETPPPPSETPTATETPTETPPPSETPTEPPPPATETGCATNCGNGVGNGGIGNGTGNEGQGQGSSKSNGQGNTQDAAVQEVASVPEAPQEEKSKSNNGKGNSNDVDLPASAKGGNKQKDNQVPGGGGD